MKVSLPIYIKPKLEITVSNTVRRRRQVRRPGGWWRVDNGWPVADRMSDAGTCGWVIGGLTLQFRPLAYSR
jgi:hypothetical protein